MMTLVPMTSAGIRSGVNWIRLNLRLKACPLSARMKRGFPQPWHAFEQCVTADEQAREHAIDDRFVTDDRLGDFRFHCFVITAELVAHGGLYVGVDAGDVGLRLEPWKLFRESRRSSHCPRRGTKVRRMKIPKQLSGFFFVILRRSFVDETSSVSQTTRAFYLPSSFSLIFCCARRFAAMSELMPHGIAEGRSSLWVRSGASARPWGAA